YSLAIVLASIVATACTGNHPLTAQERLLNECGTRASGVDPCTYGAEVISWHVCTDAGEYVSCDGDCGWTSCDTKDAQVVGQCTPCSDVTTCGICQIVETVKDAGPT